MKRNLLKQIKNEWRENFWLVVELFIVVPVIWAILVIVYGMTSGLWLPRGFDPDNVYIATTNYVGRDSPKYVDTGEDTYGSDLREIVRRIRENPNVEAVAIGNSFPYSYNYQGNNLWYDSITFLGNVRVGTPEYLDVFKIKSLTGATREQLKEMVARGDILISDWELFEERWGDPSILKGKNVYTYQRDGDSVIVHVGDVIEKIRRSDYEDSWGGTIFKGMTDDMTGDVAVRVKPGCERQFMEDFKNNPELRSQRNIYLTNLTSMQDIAETIQRSTDIALHTSVLVMAFLLITVFLGLLGSFWFRMQQRTREIAIRKVCGATRRNIFARVITEGLILLGIAVILVSACVWPFMGDIVDEVGLKWTVFLITEVIAVVLIAAGIVLSLWNPARRAMAIEPANAIKAE